MKRIDWDTLFMGMAYLVAMRSPDRSTHVGAVVVTRDNRVASMGYNGFPNGIEIPQDGDPRWERPEKYNWMVHAEANSVYNAGRVGVPLRGCRLYCMLPPCAGCAQAIVQAGIDMVIIHQEGRDEFIRRQKPDQKWVDSVEASMQMFKEARVTVVFWSGEIPQLEGFFCGETFDP